MKQFKCKFILFFVLIAFQTACGQTIAQKPDNKPQIIVVDETKKDVQTDYPNLRKQAEEFCNAVVSNDHEKAYDLTYPKLIAQKLQVLKTREKVLEYVKKRSCI